MTEHAAPAPPSADPRWEDPRIALWRKDAARLRETLRPETLDANQAWLREFFKTFGVRTISEDLLFLLYVSVPAAATFIQTRTYSVCYQPATCASSAMGHVSDGFDFFAVHLLELEKHIGEEL